jgi:ABC-type transport system involved in cytochrome c biogenesis permease subunit
MSPQAVFPYVLSAVLALWLHALLALWPGKRGWAGFSPAMGWASLGLGVLLLAVMEAWLWQQLQRPPMRTLGETRLWYSLLLPLVAAAAAWRWQARSLLPPALLMAMGFLSTLLLKPEAFEKPLMPALDSPWFVPHVIVYMLAYAALGLSAAYAAWNLWQAWKQKRAVEEAQAEQALDLARVAFPLLSAGLIFGAYWAKQAWGHYWTWDPKETWAFLTWAFYLFLIHLRFGWKLSPKATLIFLATGFLVLMGCWYGVNALPTASQSVHTYTR